MAISGLARPRLWNKHGAVLGGLCIPFFVNFFLLLLIDDEPLSDGLCYSDTVDHRNKCPLISFLFNNSI